MCTMPDMLQALNGHTQGTAATAIDVAPRLGLRIRPYRTEDRAAIRQICADTAWQGGPGGVHVPDDWLWGEFWTRYFTDREPEHTWVVERAADAPVVEHGVNARVVGYLSGTVDCRRAERYTYALLPGIVRHIWSVRLWRRRGPRRALLDMLASLLCGDTRLPRGVAAAYPATFHFNLLPEARGQGIGTRLFRTFETEIQQLGVPGLHTQSLDVNAGVARFNERAGLAIVGRRPTRAFGHIESRPIAILTWTKGLRPCVPLTSRGEVPRVAPRS